MFLLQILYDRIFYTGDIHAGESVKRLKRIARFCKEYNTTKKDLLVILGDSGINYLGQSTQGDRDKVKKEFLASLPITILCIHGNHEMRPYKVFTYQEVLWNGGIVYMDPLYPYLMFAKDGEIYDFNGKKAIAIGGAYSVDKEYRIVSHWPWWDDEQPSDEVKQYVEEQLENHNWKIDIVMSHTVPLKYVPTEAFLPGINQDAVDKSTEKWLKKIEENLKYYEAWFAGHYHIQKKIDKLQILYKNYVEL